jgi:hypothetical protein
MRSALHQKEKSSFPNRGADVLADKEPRRRHGKIEA